MTLGSPKLLPAFQRQAGRFAQAVSVLQEAVHSRVFPGAVVAVTLDRELIMWRSVGRFTYDSDSPAVAPTTVFDLASVSKAVATTTAAMILYERGKLNLESRVVDLHPAFANPDDPRRERITVRMLLEHSSGLPAWEELWRKHTTRDDLMAAVFAMPLEADPMSRAVYSDIGFIILGEILESIAREPLDAFVCREVFEPLGMVSARYLPPPDWKMQIPPTVDDQWLRYRVVQGEVNDENCSVLSGVSGHTGVFASAYDVAIFACEMLHGGDAILRPETVELFTTRASQPAGTSRAIGWDTPSQPSQAGKHFGPRSFGHLGYTGTSLWCDPDRKLSVTLLTNRTWPDRSNQEIKRVRPLVHDAILEAL